MAEAFPLTHRSEILNKFASTTLQQIVFAEDVKQHLRNLETTISSTINAEFLLDAEQKQSTNHQLRLWLGRLEDVLYDVDNVLDEFAYKALQQQLASRGNSNKKVRHNVKFRVGTGYQIKEIIKRLYHITSFMDQFHLTEGVAMTREITHSFVNPSDVIGRETDKNNILNLLTCRNIDQNLSIVPIVGIGGVGKTTIAKLVYNNVEERKCFELIMWVCISDDFNLEKVTKDVYKSATNGVDCDGLSITLIQIHLQNTLRDKKFLLVLDDIWNNHQEQFNEHQEQWKELQKLLINGGKGSKIIVTTQNPQVASIMGATEPYILKGLSDEDCWSLFAKYAFLEGEEINYPNLETIGREIIIKCKGVPLAVRNLGSMLFNKKNERDWLSIKKNEIWRLEGSQNGILSALGLRYNLLPSHLKRCFLLCSIFPKDFEFNSRELIEIWMSQGLIQSCVDNEELEDTGLIYIKELCSRDLFQDTKEKGGVMLFKMHDLVRDLALLVAQNECYMINNLRMPTLISDKIRHVSLCIKGDVPRLFELDLSNLWTLYYFSNSDGEGATKSFVRACIPKFKFIRMIDMRNSSFEVLPGSIGSLNHLRYLNISWNSNLKKLPDAICKLLHLQTLDLGGCDKLEGLPRDIGNLINLRRLWVSAKEIYLVPNKQIGLLTSLRDLQISNCPNLITSSEAMECIFPHLRSLTLSSCDSLESWPGIMKHLLALETLVIKDCKKLNLMDSTNDAHDLSFTSLRYLRFVGLPELKALPEWVQGCSNTLQSLDITECSNIICLPNWMQNLTSLHKLEVWRCHQISAMPKELSLLPLLRELIKCDH